MKDFPTISYASTCKIPTLLYTLSLKKYTLFGWRIPVQSVLGRSPLTLGVTHDEFPYGKYSDDI